MFTFSYPAFQFVSTRVFMYSQSFSPVQLFTTPWTAAHQAALPWNFPGKRTGVGSHLLPKWQGIFYSQKPNPHLLHWQLDSLPPSHLGSPVGTHRNVIQNSIFLKPQSNALSFKFLNFSSNFLGSQLPHLSPILALLIPPSY